MSPSSSSSSPASASHLTIANSAGAAAQLPRPVPVAFSSSSSSGDGSVIIQPPSLGVKFISAGLAACWADMVTFPLDTAKVRLQIQGEASRVAAAASGAGSGGGGPAVLAQASSVAKLKYRGLTGTVATMAREEGFRSLYNGLIPGLQRQLCFASVRIGFYDTVKQMYIDFFKAGSSGSSNVGLRILAGVTTGATAVLIAQPTDVVKVRLQAQKRGAGRYTGVWHAYKSIGTDEGVKGLWKGLGPNVARNAIVTACELVSYDLIKENILRRNLMSDNMPCHFVSAFGAGLVTTIIASPVDVVKTRFMNSPAGSYRGALHCAYRMLTNEGPFAFYKGFVPSFLRLGSWNIVMFVTFEQFKRGIGRLIDG